MSKLTLYKPNGRSIEINDRYDSAKIMMLDGWTLKPTDGDEKPASKVVPVTPEVAQRSSRRRR